MPAPAEQAAELPDDYHEIPIAPGQQIGVRVFPVSGRLPLTPADAARIAEGVTEELPEHLKRYELPAGGATGLLPYA